MKSFHIISSLETEAAGPSYSVRRLAQSVRSEEVDSAIFTTKPAGAASPAGADAFSLSTWGFGLGQALFASGPLRRAIEQAARDGHILHTHGLWLLPNLYPAWAAATAGAPLVSSPRGMLAPEALVFSKYKKRIMWAAAQKQALQAATCLHATSDQEAREIRAAGLTNPIAIIPNGIDVPEEIPAPNPQADAPRTVLHLGRIHPKKGLDQLIKAWALIEPTHPDWRLRIVGPGEDGHDTDLQGMAQQLGLKRVQFDGPLFGADKSRAYAEADLFVLPTRNENFGLVVAEALAHGTPVICTRGAPWEGLETRRCGWWIDYGAAPLAAGLQLAMGASKENLSAMGLRGRSWMVQNFAWPTLGERMRAVYSWISSGGAPPAWVEKS